MSIPNFDVLTDKVVLSITMLFYHKKFIAQGTIKSNQIVPCTFILL